MFVWLVAILTVIASGYFTVSGLVNPGALVPGGDTAAAKTFAAYLAARGAVLLGAMVWLLAVRAWRPLTLVFALNGVVQLVDMAIGVAHHQVARTVGPPLFRRRTTDRRRQLGQHSAGDRDLRTLTS
jgi:hypothetical protein